MAVEAFLHPEHLSELCSIPDPIDMIDACSTDEIDGHTPVTSTHRSCQDRRAVSTFLYTALNISFRHGTFS